MKDDVISRQAAIDWLTNEWDGMVTSVFDGIKKLQSAQPEIIRCEDCRYANECHKSVQYTRNEPNSVTIGFLPIEWCSRGKGEKNE